MANGKIKLETFSQTSKKKKDFLIVGGIVTVLVLVGFSVFNYSLGVDEKKMFKKKELKITDTNDVNLSTKDGLKESWAISVENSIADQNKRTDRLIKLMQNSSKSSKSETSAIIKELMKSQEAQLFKMKEELAKKETSMNLRLEESLLKQENELARIKAEASKLSPNSGSKVTEDDIELGFDLLPKINVKKDPKSDTEIDKILDSSEGKLPPKAGNPMNKGSFLDDPFSKNSGKALDEPVLKEKTKMSFRKIDTSKSMTTLIADKKKELAQIKKREKRNNSFHVMTGLTKAFLITGVYAPAFSEGKSDPLPVLMQAEGDILIANNDTQSLKDCFLIGVAKGNMNSQTADIRLNKISCSLNGGTKKIEGSISGWVIGENGIPGVQGELLHKNGAWMAKTFIAGFMETFSKSAVGFAGTSSAGGAGTATVGGSLVQSGSESTSEVFSKMGKYYLKMAEQIFPVIEVKPGRSIDIMLQGGTDLTVTDLHSAEIDEIELEIAELEAEKKADNERKSEISEMNLNTSGSSDSDLLPESSKSDELFEDE